MTTQVSNLESPQQLEVAVSGPDGADRLYICTGIVPIVQEADAGTSKQTWAWRLGPVLGWGQFRGATAHGALIRFSQSGGNAVWSLIGMDVDWDDESGQVEVRAQVQIIAQGMGSSARVQGISYQVNILAAVSPEPDKATPEAATPSVGGKAPMGAAAANPSRSTPEAPEGAAPEPYRSTAGPPPPPTTPERTPPPPPAESKPPAHSAPTVMMDRVPVPPKLAPSPLPLQGAPKPPAQPTIIDERIPAAPTPPRPSGPPPVLVLTPPVVDFGGVRVGGFRVKTLAISNTGSGDSGPLQVELAGADAAEFTVTPDAAASVNLAPGASGHVLISFQPASAGSKTASLQVRTSTGAKLEAPIVGTGN